jgi:hypothetical protein
VKNVMKSLMIVMLIAFAINGAGCSRLFGPSDEEAIKAINDSGRLNSTGFTVIAPIEIVEKGGRLDDGGWPVTVKLKLSVKTTDGQTKELVTKSNFRIYKSKDSTGKTVWTAKLG